ncbi:MAG: hypothetical protein K2N86_03185, partial [Rikenellaceae bacterium]|nr:hypothetical protein [Rikenellaceae bacterium]
DVKKTRVEKLIMGKKLDFILKVEQERAISTLNRFVFRQFSRTTTVWSDKSEHNIMVFVLGGKITHSDPDGSYSHSLDLKVTILPRHKPFILEAAKGTEILTYSFDDYLPMDTSLMASAYSHDGSACYLSISDMLRRELVHLTENLDAISRNEMVTYLSIQKVIEVMKRCYNKADMGKLFSIFKAGESKNLLKYLQIIENRENLTTKYFSVKY